LGFETDKVIVLSAALNRAKYPQPDQAALFFDNLMERVRKIPGTLSTSLSDTPPPTGMVIILSTVAVDGQNSAPNIPGHEIRQHTVTSQYFDTFKIPIIKGRPFGDSDGQNSEPAAILSEGAARILFPDQNPIGRRIRPQSIYPWHVVVGIARDIRNMGLAAKPQPELYLARSLSSRGFMWMPSALALRTTMQPKAATAILKQVAAAIDPEVPVDVKALDQQVAVLSERPRFIAWLLTTFAAFALLLAVSGLYAIASYLVSQQTRELGIRIALGASPASLVLNVMGEAIIWLAAGVFLGVPLAWIGSRIIRSELFNIAPADVISWSSALLVLVLGVLIAVLRPAIRAVRIHPTDALRAE
jgi:putative ABC transport system permease protein